MSLQEQLHQFFLLDQQIRGLRTRLDAATRRLKIQQTKIDQLARQRQELTDQLRQVQAAASGFELESKRIEERVARLREQMNTAKSNKEYSAMLVEVSTLKNDKSKVEDQALEQMAKADLLKQEVSEVEAKVAEQQKLVAGAEAEVQESKAEVGDRLNELTAQRNAAAAELPPDVLAVFERLADANDGEAMAGVIEESRRNMEYTCGGCYMQIPVERVNALITRPSDLTVCPSCGRILYMDEQLKSSMTASK